MFKRVQIQAPLDPLLRLPQLCYRLRTVAAFRTQWSSLVSSLSDLPRHCRTTHEAIKQKRGENTKFKKQRAEKGRETSDKRASEYMIRLRGLKP